MPKRIINNVLESPTLMSWASYLSKTLTLILVTPLLVTRLSSEDVALWYLFVSAIGFQLLAELGFSSTFIRMFSFAYSGLSLENLNLQNKSDNKQCVNWNTIEIIWQGMNFVYIRLSLIFILFITLSTYFLYNPILKSTSPLNSAIAWALILLTSFLQLRFSTYSHFLQGMNKIATVKKYETIFNLIGIISNTLVLYFGGSLLLLVISNQVWALLNIFRDYYLSKEINEFNTLNRTANKSEQLFKIVWPSAWKSGLGLLMSIGLIHITNLVFAKSLESKELASYLLGYNIMRQISNFAQAPFYSRIPAMASARAKGDINVLETISKKGMLLTYWAFIIFVILGGYFGTYGLKLIGSNVNFPNLVLWFALGLGILIERFGAMHIQIYSTTNKIIWHIANGITGVIFITIFYLGKDALGVNVFPTAIVLSNLFFYAWYCAYYSYKSMETNFFKFEKYIALPAFTFYILWFVIVYTF